MTKQTTGSDNKTHSNTSNIIYNNQNKQINKQTNNHSGVGATTNNKYTTMKLLITATTTFSITIAAASSLLVASSVVIVSAQEKDDIPTTAINSGLFTTLVAGLTAADLVSTVSEPNGPYTVFAPTDAAFNRLPTGLLNCLLEPENVEALSAILTYHVLDRQVLSTDLPEGT